MELEDDVKESVDIIVSEWMGYALLYEGMLSSVIYARDNFLVEGGLLFPNVATLHVAGANCAALGRELNFWDDFRGFDLSPFKALKRAELPLKQLTHHDLVTNSFRIATIDLETVRA